MPGAGPVRGERVVEASLVGGRERVRLVGHVLVQVGHRPRAGARSAQRDDEREDGREDGGQPSGCLAHQKPTFGA